MRSIRRSGGAAPVLFAAFMLASAPGQAQTHTSRPFAGPKVNGGTVTHAVQDGRHVLRLSQDFKVPDTPDPHWQVVDSRGRVFLLDRLPVKGNLGGLARDRINTTITVPLYVEDVAKVQIYCSWAEAVLGEASFDSRVQTLTSR